MNRGTFLPALILLPFFGTADADTRTAETTVAVSAPPERVLQSFLDDGDLKRWWQVSRSLVDGKPGGVWAVAWDDYGDERTHHTWSGVIEEISPSRLIIGSLVMNEPNMPLFGPLQLEIVVAPTSSGSLLTVYHRGYQDGHEWDWMYETVVKGWKHVLGDLQTWFAEKAAATPDERHQ